MALKELDVTIQGDPKTNRDVGKRFVIIEMAAVPLEKWGVRALMALGTSGIAVPQDLADAGVIGIALLGYQVFMGAEFSAIEPLMDEMMMCVHFSPTGEISMSWNPTLVEEVSTLRLLREKWMELHTGFTLADVAQKLREAVAAKLAAKQSISSDT